MELHEIKAALENLPNFLSGYSIAQEMKFDLDKIDEQLAKIDDDGIECCILSINFPYRQIELILSIYMRITLPDTEVSFSPQLNYSIWTPDQFSPYQAGHPQETIKDAIMESMTTFVQDTRGRPDEVVFWENQKNREIIDSNGTPVSEEEVKKRRAEYKK